MVRARQLTMGYTTDSIAASNFDDLFIGQLRCAIVFTTRAVLRVGMLSALIATRRSALNRHIVHIVGMRAQKQMVRANARRIVTFVTHFQSVWDSAVMQLPRKAVCENPPITAPADTHAPMSKGDAISCPFPASICFLYLFPEAICNGARVFRVATLRIVASEGMMAALTAWCGRIRHAGSSFQLSAVAGGVRSAARPLVVLEQLYHNQCFSAIGSGI